MRRSFVHAVCSLLLLIPCSLAFGQQQTPPISIENIRGAIYQVKGGSGANTGFFIGEREVVVIDAKMTEDSADRMMGEIRKLTANPISHVIITHSDRDHVNGLVSFAKGINIISHENTRKQMDSAFQTARERGYLPGITFSDRLSLYLEKTSKTKRIDLVYFGPAHTDGDVVVCFPDEKVAFIGDLIFIGRDQLIHRHKNGSSFGLVKVLKNILNLDAEVFISGHSDPVSKQEIENHLKGIEEKQSKIQAMVKEGKTLDEIKRLYNIDDRPAQPDVARRPSLVEIIYLEITAKN